MTTDHPPTLTNGLAPGAVLHEYTVLEVLGIGGFGITYLARDNHLQHQVAIKEYFPSTLAVRAPATGAVALNSESSRDNFAWGKSRFIGEAQTLARFRHNNIVQVFRFFEANNTSYMVMAYEEGRSLESLLREKSEWSEADIFDLLLPLLDGLQAVHQAGFLHRDIKPANIIVRSKDGTPVLLDFGSARSAVSTHTLTAIVSPGYGPLEQYSDAGDQGPWTDIYAMGAVLYRIVSGSPPAPAHQRLKKDALLPAVFAAKGNYRADFLNAIDEALRLDEALRPQSIEAWRSLLTGATTKPLAASAAHGAPTRQGTSIPSGQVAHPPSQRSVPVDDMTRRYERPFPWKPAMATALILMIAAGFLYSRNRPERAPDAMVATPALPVQGASAMPSTSATAPTTAAAIAPATASPGVAATMPARPELNIPPSPAETAAPPQIASPVISDTRPRARPEPMEGNPAAAPERMRGAPAASFPGVTNGPAAAAPQTGRPAHEEACSGKHSGDRCEFVGRFGEPMSGVCDSPPGSNSPQLVCTDRNQPAWDQRGQRPPPQR